MKNTQILTVGLAVYGIATTLWIANDTWQDFQRDYVKGAATQAYQAGQTGAVKQLLTEAEKCKAFEVFAGEEKVQLMNLACQESKKSEPVALAPTKNSKPMAENKQQVASMPQQALNQ